MKISILGTVKMKKCHKIFNSMTVVERISSFINLKTANTINKNNSEKNIIFLILNKFTIYKSWM